MSKDLMSKLADEVVNDDNKKVDNNESPIQVRRAICFNFDNRISDTDEETNANALEEALKENPKFNRLQTVKGYIIRNHGTKTIKDIVVPKYEKKDDLYVGIERTVDLAPGKDLAIPIKFLVLLLLRPEYNLECQNGKFIKKFNEMALQKGDWDAVMSSMRFQPNSAWKEKLEKDGFYYPIGSMNYDANGKKLGWTIEESEYAETFGYLCNPIQKGKAGRGEIKITLKSAEILGALMYLQSKNEKNRKGK